MLNLHKNSFALTKEQIIDYYESNCKQESEFKIGLEYERVSVNSKTLENAPYEDLRQIITHFAIIKGWGTLKDDGVIIGAISGKSSVSLEPGGQFEISLEPKEYLEEIEKEMNEIISLLDSIGKVYDVRFLPIGVTPKSVYQNIGMVKKSRYVIMSGFLPEKGAQGKLAPVMMRETAGVQVNCDFKNGFDALLKLSTCALVSPFLTGLFANSPIRNNKINNYKSFRALAWHFTDKNRCGLFYKNLVKWRPSLGFEDYADAILDVPMLFFERSGKKIVVNGEITFKEFLNKGYNGYQAELMDYKLHASLCFPDVRLKNCIEIRNHDSQKMPFTLAICAFYKGILHNDNALLEVQKILKWLPSEDISKLALDAARYGLDFSADKKSAFEVTENLFNIAKDSLAASEKHYLKPVLKMLKNRECMADIILKNGVRDALGLVDFLYNN